MEGFLGQDGVRKKTMYYMIVAVFGFLAFSDVTHGTFAELPIISVQDSDGRNALLLNIVFSYENEGLSGGRVYHKESRGL